MKVAKYHSVASRIGGLDSEHQGVLMVGRKETTIERVYREVTGREMSPVTKRILLPKRKFKRR